MVEGPLKSLVSLTACGLHWLVCCSKDLRASHEACQVLWRCCLFAFETQSMFRKEICFLIMVLAIKLQYRLVLCYSRVSDNCVVVCTFFVFSFYRSHSYRVLLVLHSCLDFNIHCKSRGIFDSEKCRGCHQ